MADFLRRRYGGDRFLLVERSTNLLETIDVFGRTKILVGVHGGALYNSFFGRRDLNVVELMPTDLQHGEAPIPAHLAHTIVWQMTDGLPEVLARTIEPVHRRGDVVSVEVLDRVRIA